MDNNYIGIDISLNSTSIYIESDNRVVLSFTSKKDNNIYIKELDRHGVVFHHQDKVKGSDYSTNEIIKIKNYDLLSDKIISSIIENIDISKKTYCMIEGYSFSKNTSSILDIVSFSTLIKVKLSNSIKNIEMSIISPKSLKLEACKMCYEPINVGKKKPKYEYRNKNGVSGGSFKKPEMFLAMLDGKIDSPITNFLLEYSELSSRDKIPNPIEDIIDSIFACKIKINSVKNDFR